MVKFNKLQELRCLWIIKELGLASIEEVADRYVELFENELDTVALIVRRWKARRGLVVEDGRYKIARPPPWFVSLSMANLISLGPTEAGSMLKELRDMFQTTKKVIDILPKWRDYHKLTLTFEALDPILGGRTRNGVNDQEKNQLYFPRSGEKLVAPIGWLRAWIRDNQRLMNVSSLHRYLAWGMGIWEDDIKLIKKHASVIVKGRGVGITTYEAVPPGSKFTVVCRVPFTGCNINSVSKFKELFQMVSETPVRGLGANSRAFGGRMRLLELKEEEQNLTP